MTGRNRWFGLLLIAGGLVVFGAPRGALASEDPAEVTEGSAYVKLGTEFAIPFEAGERYENHAFEKEGKVLVLAGLDRTVDHEFELRPSTDEYEPMTLKVKTSCWKLKKVEKLLKVWRCDLTAKFPKGKPKTSPEPAPEPETDPDIPPMPGVPPPPPDYQD